MSTTLHADEFTMNPATDAERDAFETWDDGYRVIVRLMPEDQDAIHSDDWYTTTDERTGLAVQVRRADCGAGCRCAVEVRLTEGATR